jgi:DNA-binding NtrC family response regulator
MQCERNPVCFGHGEAEVFMDMADRQLSAMIEDVDNVARVLKAIAACARGSEPVLLLGGRSTGASLLAEVIHACSGRPEESMVRARCGRYTGVLLEALLFSGPVARRRIQPRGLGGTGTVAAANGGSLFVEQIQNATASVQARLTDLVANQRYVDFTKKHSYSADVRLIASAEADLGSRASCGQFSPKLLSRLWPCRIELNESCMSRTRLLNVIELLRAELTPQAAFANAQVTDWWCSAARTATRNETSIALREAVETAAKKSSKAAPVESILIGAVEHLSKTIAEPRRVEMQILRAKVPAKTAAALVASG